MTDLMSMMPKYEAYKDSGVAWIGEIPDHWEIIRVKNIILDGKKGIKIGPFGSSLKSELFVESGYKVYGQEHAIAKDFFIGQKYIGERDFKRLINYQIFPNDIIVTMMGTTGKCQVVPQTIEAGIMDSHLIRLKVKEFFILPNYFEVLINDSIYIHFQVKIKSKGSIMDGLNSSIVKSLIVILPPISEQTAIANFLDCKTPKIDQAVAIKKKQIHLLKERKQILIQNAVTKGLNPDALMHNSGVEWIGEIPKHWNMKRAKYLFKEVDERSTTGKEELLSVSHMTGVTPRSEKNVNMFMAENYTGSKTCQNNDLVFNIMWAWMGALGVSDRAGIVSSSYGIFRQQKDGQFNPNYLEFLLKTAKYIVHYNKVSTGLHSSRLRFYGHMFFDMVMGFPDRKEQDQIVTHIQIQSAKIDKAIAIQEQMIEKLKEYKATLINSAVIGKIKVPPTGEERAVA